MRQLLIFGEEEKPVSRKSLDKLSIVETIDDLIPGYFLRQKVSPNYKGLCIFHLEQTPSMIIKPEKNFFRCYGCNSVGGPIGLTYYITSLTEENRIVNKNKIQLPKEYFFQYLSRKVGFNPCKREDFENLAREVNKEIDFVLSLSNQFSFYRNLKRICTEKIKFLE